MTGMEIVPANPQKLNNFGKSLAIAKGRGYQAEEVPHLDMGAVRRMIEATRRERDKLLIATLFDSCLRASECISIRPCDLVASDGGWLVNVLGKGHKRSSCAISAGLAAQLQAYCYRHKIAQDARVFPITRARAFQIVQAAMIKAGVTKPDGVGTVHVLRHSGALERLRKTGNPKAVQEQLRHNTAEMTLRYMKTLSHEESMAIQQGVDYQW